jgi:hypothetical protein
MKFKINKDYILPVIFLIISGVALIDTVMTVFYS